MVGQDLVSGVTVLSLYYRTSHLCWLQRSVVIILLHPDSLQAGKRSWGRLRSVRRLGYYENQSCFCSLFRQKLRVIDTKVVTSYFTSLLPVRWSSKAPDRLRIFSGRTVSSVDCQSNTKQKTFNVELGSVIDMSLRFREWFTLGNDHCDPVQGIGWNVITFKYIAILRNDIPFHTRKMFLFCLVQPHWSAGHHHHVCLPGRYWHFNSSNVNTKIYWAPTLRFSICVCPGGISSAMFAHCIASLFSFQIFLFIRNIFIR